MHRPVKRRLLAGLLGLAVAIVWSATARAVIHPATVPATVIGQPGTGLEYFPCAVEGGLCLGAANHYAAYGADGHFIFRLLPDDRALCSNEAFGGDPAPGIVKSCYYANYSQLTTEGDRRNPISQGGE